MSVDDDDECSGRPLTGTMIGNVAKVWETILKTKDEWFMIFATLSGVVWNVPVNFVGLVQHVAQGSKICAKADKQWSKSNTALLSALSSWNRLNTTPPSSPTSSLVMNLGYDPETKQQVTQRKTPTSPWPKKAQRVRSNVQSMLICFFGTKASCIRNLFHQDRRLMENSIMMFWGEWGKTSSANVRTSGATSPGPCTITMLRLMHPTLCGSFWFLWTWPSSPTLPTHRTSPPLIFPVPKDEIEAQRAMFWQQWRYPEQHRMWWRRWCEMTFSNASDLGNPAGSLYQCRRGYFEGNGGEQKFSKWLSCSLRILGTFG